MGVSLFRGQQDTEQTRAFLAHGPPKFTVRSGLASPRILSVTMLLGALGALGQRRG